MHTNIHINTHKYKKTKLKDHKNISIQNSKVKKLKDTVQRHPANICKGMQSLRTRITLHLTTHLGWLKRSNKPRVGSQIEQGIQKCHEQVVYNNLQQYTTESFSGT